MKPTIRLYVLVLCFLAWVVSPVDALGQSTQTFYVKAKLSPDNESPAITGVTSSGTALARVTVDRDVAGTITSGVVTFDVAYQFGRAVTLTGFHFHSAAVGSNGPVVINSGLASTPEPDGVGSLTFTTPALTTAEQITALNGLATTPHLYYINLHTSDNPGGEIRGQCTTETHFYRANMLPSNEVPPIPELNASASALITLDVTRDTSGAITSGAVMFDTNYNFPVSTTFNGFHIHTGRAGENGGHCHRLQASAALKQHRQGQHHEADLSADDAGDAWHSECGPYESSGPLRQFAYLGESRRRSARSTGGRQPVQQYSFRLG